MRCTAAFSLLLVAACSGSSTTGGTDDTGSSAGQDTGQVAQDAGGGGEDAGAPDSGVSGDDAGQAATDAGGHGGGDDAGMPRRDAGGGMGPDGGHGPRDAGAPHQGCGAVWRCVLRCDPQDMQCFGGCMDRVPPGQEQNASDVVQCIGEFQCQDEACVLHNCGDAVRRCEDGAPPRDGGPPPPADGGLHPAPDAGQGGGGGTNCPETMMCYINCPRNDDACRRGCVAGADPAQAGVTDPLVACIERNHCRDGQCIATNCQAESDACGAGGGGGPPPGQGTSCAEALACVGRCGPDLNCVFQCYGSVRDQSRPIADALQQCMMQNRCADLACGQRHCARQMAACSADN